MKELSILRGREIKTGDTPQELRLKCLDDGIAFDLTGYTVNISIQRTDADELLIDSSATVADEGRGIITYDLTETDTSGDGTYLVEAIADDGSGSVVTFPDSGYTRMYIQDRLE